MFKSYSSLGSRDNLSWQILSAAVLSKQKIIRVLSLGPVKILQVQRVISLPALTSGIDHGLLVPGKLPGERTVGGKIPKKLWDAGERQPGLLAKSGPPRTHGRPAKNSEARNTCQASDPERGDRRSRKKNPACPGTRGRGPKSFWDHGCPPFSRPKSPWLQTLFQG